MKTETQGTAKNLVKALDLLQIVADNEEGLTLGALSGLSGVSKPTVHRLLGVLLEAGMLKLDGEGLYRLGSQCLVLGSAFLASLDLRREAVDLLKGLARETGEACHLGIRDGARVIYIEKVESPSAIRMYSRVGTTNPLHCTALGKAILAYCNESDIEMIISEGLERRTAQTITEPNRLRTELARTTSREFAIDDVENEDGIRCVAAPVLNHEGEPIAAISVAGPEYRIPAQRISSLGDKVRRAALTLSRRFGYLDTSLVAKMEQTR